MPIKLDVIKFLLIEIEEEQKLWEEFNQAKETARASASLTGKSWWSCFTWTKRWPRKASIKANLLKIRKLTLAISKEAVGHD
ncbi:hypothetical protein SPFL3102_03561 [Sporomusaceae bacterium FL31]|nr:hypothetical protein SPFL3101_00444 [Sporomusaceae bacterium FL31]GCE35710.1 hypothetical protein SPFL3102_03561 [Sporomusaceae bacterium]